VVTTASPLTLGTQAPPATTGKQGLALLPGNGDEQNLALARQLPKLYNIRTTIPRPIFLSGAIAAVGEGEGRQNRRQKWRSPIFRLSQL